MTAVSNNPSFAFQKLNGNTEKFISQGLLLPFLELLPVMTLLMVLISSFGMERVGRFWGTLTRTSSKTIWPQCLHGKSGKILGRFIAAAAFTADVKVWEIVCSKDGSVKEVAAVMQLKGHKSAVTWLCFSPNSEQIITASKDGTIRIWNINGTIKCMHDLSGQSCSPAPVQNSKTAKLYCQMLYVNGVFYCPYKGMLKRRDKKTRSVATLSSLWLSRDNPRADPEVR
ncbi:hypothetical protein MKX03_006559 [Papaver bracteatum]|nr:hypothetical protein MKX03_006559 [Papaver bracteatum]